MKLRHLQKILKRRECVLYIQPVDLHFNFTIKGSCEIIVANCVFQIVSRRCRKCLTVSMGYLMFRKT